MTTNVVCTSQLVQGLAHHTPKRRRWKKKYLVARYEPTGRPITTTWDRLSDSGLSRMGFISTVGSIPAASAWTTCARPISPPSTVT